MSRILVTGAAGMVGRALVQSLPEGDLTATDLAATGLPDGSSQDSSKQFQKSTPL